MATNAPFTPTGNTIAIAAATTAPAALQALSTTLGGNQYMILNSGNVTVFMGSGSNASLANINGGSLVVTAGSNVGSVPVLANSVKVVSLSPNYYFTAQTAAGSATVYITPGDGM